MKIGEAAARSGVSARMIRHYEGIGLLPLPTRRDTGYRDYAIADIARLRFIANARRLGFTTPRINDLLSLWTDKERSSADVRKLALDHIALLAAEEARLAAMRQVLEAMSTNCRGDDTADCPIIDALAHPSLDLDINPGAAGPQSGAPSI